MKRTYNNFQVFIYRILKREDPKFNISAEAKEMLNQLIAEIALKYIKASIALCIYAKRITIDSKAISALTMMWILEPEPILTFASEAWERYTTNTTVGIKKGQRAGLYLPPTRFKGLFAKYVTVQQMIGESGYIYLTAIIEYFLCEILHKGCASLTDTLTLKGWHLCEAIQDLPPLLDLFEGNLFIAGAVFKK